MLFQQNSAILKENAEFKAMMLDVVKNGTIRHTTTTNNNFQTKTTFNVQFFLNEICKDAMNITDFVNQIQLSLSDLERFGQDGYVDGISHVFVRELKKVDVTKRPIHCSDSKREIFYVKDNDAWEKEPEHHPKITSTIQTIEQKNMTMLSEYQKAHPEYMDYNSKTNTQYNKIIVNAVGVFDSVQEKEMVHNKIIGRLSDAAAIEKIKFAT